jgi:hypothetical protein
MRSYLLGQQFSEDLGWRPQDPAYGAWGMGGVPRRGPGDPGHVDLSMTRVVLQGLADAVPSPTKALVRSRAYLGRCTNNDGGFFFSTIVLGANKGGRSGDAFNSYGTTTADGILCLLASGLQEESTEVCRARAWLVSNHPSQCEPNGPGEFLPFDVCERNGPPGS